MSSPDSTGPDTSPTPKRSRKSRGAIWLAVDGVVCWGPVVPRPDGGITREQRLVLVQEWCPAGEAATEDPDTAAAELFTRYAQGHGPVTAADFAVKAPAPD